MVAAKKSYDFDGLFTAMTVNELYDVNGGVISRDPSRPTRLSESHGSSTGETDAKEKKDTGRNIRSVIATVAGTVIGTVTPLGNPPEHTEAVIEGNVKALKKILKCE